MWLSIKIILFSFTNLTIFFYLYYINSYNEIPKEIKASDIIDPLNFQIPIAMKWIIKKEDVEKRVFLNVASQYHLPQLPDVFLRFSIIKDRSYEDMIRIDTEVDKGPEKRIRKNFKFRVPTANYSKWVIGDCVKKGFYITNFTTKTDLLNPERNFFVNGNLILDITGIISVDREIKKSDFKKPLIYFQSDVGNVDQRNFSLVVEGKRIMSAFYILAEASPVFAEIFQSNMNKMEITDFSYKTVELGIKLCYDNTILESNLDMQLYRALLRFADKYNMQKVREIIEAEMAKTITIMTVVEIANDAISFNAPILRQKCFDFILEAVRSRDSLMNIEKLDKNFAFEIFQQSFYRISQTVDKQFYD